MKIRSITAYYPNVGCMSSVFARAETLEEIHGKIFDEFESLGECQKYDFKIVVEIMTVDFKKSYVKFFSAWNTEKEHYSLNIEDTDGIGGVLKIDGAQEYRERNYLKNRW